jgi:pilus assembly protein CpaE
MSVINPKETAKVWRTNKPESAVRLYLTGAEGDVAQLVGARAAGFPLSLSVGGFPADFDPQELAGATAAVIQIDPESPDSLKRFQELAASTKVPLIAAAYEPPLAFVRALVRSGAHDVVPLPLDMADLEASLAPIREHILQQEQSARASKAKVVSIIKCGGGAGATALLTQLGIRFAEAETRQGREACLIDLDVQFGDAAFQLGLRPSLSLVDLVDAGSRLDADLLRSTVSEHSSGLKVIASPPEMMPLDAFSVEQMIDIVELAAREFGTVLLDLPSNWTNWSLSLLARSDLVLMVTELTLPGLQRARRQLELIKGQDLDAVDVRIVANQFEKGLLKTIRPADIRDALGREISHTVSNDDWLMRSAIDRGVPIGEIKRKTALGKDIDALDSAVAAALGLER